MLFPLWNNKHGRRAIVTMPPVVALVAGLIIAFGLGGHSSPPGTANTASVVGVSSPACGTNVLSSWTNTVELVRDGVVVASQPVTLHHESFTLDAPPGEYTLTNADYPDQVIALRLNAHQVHPVSFESAAAAARCRTEL